MLDEGESVASVSVDTDGRLLIQGYGKWSERFSRTVVRGLEVAVQRELTYRCFWDFNGLDGYESVVRREITSWLVHNYRQLAPHHRVIAANTLVAMGVSTAGVALALVGVRVETTRDREVFRRWLEAD